MFIGGCGLFIEDWKTAGGTGGSGGDATSGGGAGAGAGDTGGGGGAGAPSPVWCRFYGTPADESLWDVRADADGRSLIGAAGIAGPITLGTLAEPAGSTDGILIRFDAAGEPAIFAQLGASDGGALSAVFPSVPPIAGGYYVGTAGSFTSTPGGSGDLVLMDAADGPLVGAGTSASDHAVDGDARGDRVVFTGPSGAGIDFGDGPAPSGGIIGFASRSTGTVDAAIALGAGSSPGAGHMARFSPSGDVVWAAVALGGPGVTDVVCDGVALESVVEEQTAILKISADGECLVGRVLPPEVQAEPDIAVRDDGGVVVSGRFTETFTIDSVSAGPARSTTDAFVATVDGGGTFTAMFTYGSAGSERPNEVIVGALGDIFVAGEFSGAMTVGSETVASVDDSDLYLMKLDSALGVGWLRALAGSGLQSASALSVDGTGNLYLGGSAEGSLACATPAPESAGGRDMFLMRFDAGDL